MPKYDAIIIGGGHNGLVTAAYLARAGRKVLVLERRELVGGCAVTEEIWPGYRVSTAAYLTSLMQERIVRELELERFGYRVDAKDPAFFSAFPDGRHFFMWQDRARTLAEIAKFSRRDAEVYPAYEDQLERLSQVVEGLLLTTPPQFPPAGLGDFIDYLKLAGRMRGLSAQEMVALVKIFTQSAAEFLDEWFESEQVKVTLATDGVIGANGGPRSPGTAYILLHHCMGGVAGHRGLWGFVRGGMGAVSEAIAASARARGATIRTNAPVAQVLVRSGRACGRGARERRGDRRRRDRLQPRSQGHVSAAGRTSATSIPNSSRPFAISASKAQAARSTWRSTACRSSRRFRARPGRSTAPPCTSAPSIEYVERAWDDAKYGRPSERPLLELTMPTMYDPSLAPPGKHIMGIFLQYAPYTLREGTWDELREPFGDRVISLIEEYAPNIRRDRRASAGADAARSGAALRHHRRQHLPRRDEPGPDVRDASGGRLGALSNAASGAVSVRLGRAPGRRRDGRAGVQLRAGNAEERAGVGHSIRLTPLSAIPSNWSPRPGAESPSPHPRAPQSETSASPRPPHRECGTCPRSTTGGTASRAGRR